MEAYCEGLAKQGYTASSGRAVLYGYLKLRARNRAVAKVQLDPVRDALVGWLRVVPERVRDPAPEEAIYLLCIRFWEARRFDLAFATMIGFDTYARPSEVIGILEPDVLRPSPNVGPQYSAEYGINFGPGDTERRTKNGEQDECVIIGRPGRPWLGRLFSSYLAHIRLAEPLFPGLTLAAFEKAVTKAALGLHLQRLHLTPHILRHSGPSNDLFRKRSSLSQVKARGRWKAQASAARYAKHAQLLRQLQVPPPSVQATLKDAPARFRELCKKGVPP